MLSESDSDDASGSDDSTGSSELEEPQLKYDRLRNDLLEILDKDAASCAAMNDKFVALGTHWGMIYIFDHQGNNISNKKFASHNTQITGISLDNAGENVATCSDDGKVVVAGLYDDVNNQSIQADRPVKSVALDPLFHKNSNQQLVFGTDKLVLCEKGWLSRSKQTVLHVGEGLVRNIKWRGQLIAWSNDWGVKMYDVKLKRRITHIPRSNPPGANFRPELYPTHLSWKDDATLIVGFANDIKICQVREHRTKDLREATKVVEIVYQITTDFACCGIAPFGSQFVVLTLNLMEEDSKQINKKELKPTLRPELKLLELDPGYKGGYDEISSDALSIRGYQTYRCNDYSLEYEPEEGLLYVISPKDIVVAKSRDKDDHVDWLLETGHFEEALEAVDRYKKELKKHTFMEVGMTYLEYLLNEEEFEECARASVRVLENDTNLWEQVLYKFAHAGQLKILYPFLPRGDVRLPQNCYELVLDDFLKTDHQGFSKLIKEWPSDLYNLALVINMVLAQLDKNAESPTLLAALAKLYEMDQRFDRAFSIYLKLRHPDTFYLIRKHNLYESLQRNIVLLMEFGGGDAVSLLIDNVDYVSIEKVVTELNPHKEFLHLYLHGLFMRDPNLGGEYHELQVRLYAEFDRSKLLSFLKSSKFVDLEEALKICEERDYIEEQVYLHTRMGNPSRALTIIIQSYNDVSRAVKFCKELNDVQIWEELITLSLDKPHFIKGLLETIGTHVDPVILIRRIPKGMQIPGLRDALVKIMQDYSMQTSMWWECKRILSSDVLKLMKKQRVCHTRSFRIDEERICEACGLPIMMPLGPVAEYPIMVIFMCTHVFHDECLSSQNRNACSVCSGQRKRRFTSTRD